MKVEDPWPVGESRFVRAVPAERVRHAALAYCVGSVDEFLTSAWRRRPCLATSVRSDAFADVMTVAEVEDLVSSRGLRSDQLRVSREGRRVDEAVFSRWGTVNGAPVRGMVRPSLIYSLMAEGATVVLDDVDKYSPKVAAYCRSISRSLGYPTQASIYVTAPGHQGLNPHTDDDHVLVLQLAGAKRWTVGHPDSAPDVDAVLHPGDCLYVPGETMHSAAAQPGEISVHLTIGISVLQDHRLVSQVADVVGVTGEPVGAAGAQQDSTRARDAASDVRAAVADFARRVDALSDEDLADALSVYGSMGHHPFPVPLETWAGLGRVDGHTRLRLVDDAVLALKRVSQSTCHLRFGVKQVRVPIRAARSLSEVNPASFVLTSVLGEGAEQSAVELAKLLVAEGVAVTCAAAGAGEVTR